jgi:2',3'-cyclic-nucleotide 2'-phosphodiesterase (5'-nucleotidase family)
MSKQNTTIGNLLAAIRQIGEDHNLAAVLVHMNDTPHIEERLRGKMPGLPRVASVVRRIRDEVESTVGSDVTLVLHSGDFLYPSLLSDQEHGRQMVDVLNKLGVSYCTLGNHEFDLGAEVLESRLSELSFQVVLANLHASEACQRAPFDGYALWPPQDPYLAIVGVMGQDAALEAEKHGFTWEDARHAMGGIIRELRQQPNVGALIVLSHMSRDEDKRLQDWLNSAWQDRGFSYILGGHDHDISWTEADRLHCMLAKNFANAHSIRVIVVRYDALAVIPAWHAADRPPPLSWITQRKPAAHEPCNSAEDAVPLLRTLVPEIDNRDIRKALENRVRLVFSEQLAGQPDSVRTLEWALFHAWHQCIEEFRQYNSTVLGFSDLATIRPEPEVDALVKSWVARISPCSKDDQLIRDFAHLADYLDGCDASLRMGSTNFGNFIADCIELGSEADVALVNAGSFRVDALLPPCLHYRDLRETFLYDKGKTIFKLPMTPDEYRALLEHAASQPGHGRFLQVSNGAKDIASRNASGLQVALVSYMIFGEVDGYAKVLADRRGLSVEQLRSSLDHLRESGWGLKDLVERQAENVGYSEDDRIPMVKFSDEMRAKALEVILWIDEYLDACQAENMEMSYLHALLDENGPRLYSWRVCSYPPANVMRAREELRHNVRELAADKGLSFVTELYKYLAACRERFERKRWYEMYLDHAATAADGYYR